MTKKTKKSKSKLYCTAYKKQKECKWFLNDNCACNKCAYKILTKNKAK